MLQRQRQDKILKYLAEHDYLTVNQAVKMLKASPATVRRDFSDLASSNVVERVRGGIRQRLSGDTNLPFALRAEHEAKEKDALARRAVELLAPGNVVFIDGGTTTARMALCIPDIDLRLITNSLRIGSILEERAEAKQRLEIFLTGGYLYTKSGILLGPNTEEYLRHYHADIAFLSVGGIDADGISNTTELVVNSERVMIENAERVVILADHTKVGRRVMCRVCDLAPVDYLITDEWPENDDVLHSIETLGVEVIRIPSP